MGLRGPHGGDFFLTASIPHAVWNILIAEEKSIDNDSSLEMNKFSIFWLRNGFIRDFFPFIMRVLECVDNTFHRLRD